MTDVTVTVKLADGSTATFPAVIELTECAPAKMWRNRFRVPAPYVLRMEPDLEFGAGEHWGPRTHPSKDVAETVWHERITVFLEKYCITHVCEYLGAFEVDN